MAVKHLTPGAYRLRLERNGFQFQGGQCVNIGLPGAAVNREYSTYSGENDPHLDLLIKEVQGGIVSVALKTLKPGDRVEVHGPYGEFCLKDPKDDRRKYVFIATGTGIAPFHSFVRSYPRIDYKIIHGIRLAAETYDREDYAPGRYVACVSREAGGDFRGRVTEYLRQHPVDAEAICYLCGNRSMITEAYELLRAQMVPSSHIFTEVFF